MRSDTLQHVVTRCNSERTPSQAWAEHSSYSTLEPAGGFPQKLSSGSEGWTGVLHCHAPFHNASQIGTIAFAFSTWLRSEGGNIWHCRLAVVSPPRKWTIHRCTKAAGSHVLESFHPLPFQSVQPFQLFWSIETLEAAEHPCGPCGPCGPCPKLFELTESGSFNGWADASCPASPKPGTPIPLDRWALGRLRLPPGCPGGNGWLGWGVWLKPGPLPGVLRFDANPPLWHPAWPT